MMLDVLVIAAHPDDAEIGASGAILKCKADGLRVGVLDLTSGEPTPHGSLEIRKRETDAATEILGLDWRENLGLPNRSLEATIEARRKLAAVIRQQRPRWLMTHYWTDAHPDHVAACELVEAARFWSKLTKSDIPGEPHHPEKIFHFFSVHLKTLPQPDFVLDISPYWEKKLAAISCYESQFITGRPTEPPTFTDQLQHAGGTMGASIGVAYGEPFACREPVGLRALGDLL